MLDPKSLAERAAITNFLNCYIRETRKGEWLPSHSSILDAPALHLQLSTQPVSLYIRVRYWSPTGRHLYDLPVYMQLKHQALKAVGIWTALSMLIDDLAFIQGHAASRELLYHVLQSAHHLEAIIAARQGDEAALYHPDLSFQEAEQSLLFGHTFHPTPKSRQGFPEWRHHQYAPEMKGEFQAHYFAAHKALVKQRGAVTHVTQQASDIIREELVEGVTDAELQHVQRVLEQLQSDSMLDYQLIPVHPVQAEWLLHEAHVQSWLDSRQLVYLGALGKKLIPTSSLRTVYHKASRSMYKFSLRVKITNSLRINKRYELDGAIEACQLLACIQPVMSVHFPHFHIISDHSYMSIGDSNENSNCETGFELLIRSNPFREGAIKQAVVMAALTQETIDGSMTWLAQVIGRLKDNSKISLNQVCRKWFRRYIAISLDPLIWLYNKYGIALEAHLQNCVVTLDEEGYPEQLYYRDSQGYYYARTRLDQLERLMPGIQASRNVYDDELIEERFGYYLIVNHLFGLIQAFGTAGLIEERILLLELHEAIESLILTSNENTAHMLRSWISSPDLRCKANLLTRLYDVDELESELEQAVYVSITNPLCREIPSMELVRKARKVTARWRQETWKAIG